jgi:hypothetical protein
MEETHQLLLQFLFSHRIISHSSLKQFEEEVLHVNDNGLKKRIDLINRHIEFLKFQIRGSTPELGGEVHYAVVNMKNDPVSQLGAEYTNTQIQCFKIIVEGIVDDETGHFNTKAIKKDLPSSVTREFKENVTIFVEHGWFEDTDGVLSFGVKSLVDLYPYFTEDVFERTPETCKSCNDYVFRHVQCNNCKCKLHMHCAKRIFESLNSVNCPWCKKEFGAIKLATKIVDRRTKKK